MLCCSHLIVVTIFLLIALFLVILFFSEQFIFFMDRETGEDDVSGLRDVTKSTLLGSSEHQVVIVNSRPDLLLPHGPPGHQGVAEAILLV